MKANENQTIREVAFELRFEPLSESNWEAFENLFGSRGGCGSCWYQTWRYPKKEFEEGKQNGINRMRMKELVRNGRPTGIVALSGGEAVAWCALAPREDFVKLEKSRVHKRIDDKPVWSITCFLVAKKYRMQGISGIMIREVIDWAKKKGIIVLEAYPYVTKAGKLPDPFVWTGLLPTFKKAGFEIADNTSKSNPTVRLYL
jgi:GNAT superfamily N-acetyltransferase